MDNKTLVMYHGHNCLDGFGSAFVAYWHFGESAEYIPINYGELNTIEDLSKLDYINKDIYILDFAIRKELLDHLVLHSNKVVWLDHHKASWNNYLDRDPDSNVDQYSVSIDNLFINLDMSMSGALLTWKHFNGDREVPYLINLIDDYDRWVFKLNETKAFEVYMSNINPWSIPKWVNVFGSISEYINNDLKWPYEEINKIGKHILETKATLVDAIIKHNSNTCRIRLSNGEILKGKAVNFPTSLKSIVNDLGAKLYLESNTYGLVWTIDKDLICKCSIRSTGDFDVSRIARDFGGNGHLNSAGFTVPLNTLTSWIDIYEIGDFNGTSKT